MTTSAISAFGTLLKMGDGATPEVFTSIAEVRDITAPGISLDTEEVTNHVSSTDGWKEKIATLLSLDAVTLDLNFLPAGATHSYSTGLIKDAVNRTRRNFKIVFPDVGVTTWTFAAFVGKFGPKAPVNGRLSADVTLEPTGKPTLA